jgi:hypothetical protein
MVTNIDFKLGKEIEWLELNLLKNKKPLSKSKIINLASGVDEETVDGWLSEIDNRSKLFFNPLYTIKNNIIIPKYSWEEVPEYFLCLFYSFYGANDYSGGTSLFEKVSANTLKNFIEGEIYTLGFPTVQNFNNHLDEIARCCHEQRGMHADTSYKDDGVDVLAYKSFGDNRSSNLYVLLQCAAGKHWKAKNPIIVNRWTNYIIWYPENLIQSISTVEFVAQKDWDKEASKFGMLIDRVRIINFLYKNGVDLGLRKDVYSWCKSKLTAEII